MTGMTPVELNNAWTVLSRGKDVQARNRLIEHYAYLVKITAGRVVGNLPPNMERDDLVGAGVVGLIKAVDQFDPGRKVKFETYAIALIRGAILEMLRDDDWVPRSVRENIKMLERTYRALERQFYRPATKMEVAEALEIDIDALERLLLDAGRTSLLSLEDILVKIEGNDVLYLSDVLPDTEMPPSHAAEIKIRKQMLGKAIDRLPERERLLVSLYYYEGLTFREIGKVLNISESRVYQLHSQAMLRLNGYLQRDEELFC